MSDEIVNAALAFERARTRLLRRIAAQCPGPHQFVQHRDRRPPWCKACRYTVNGTKVAESKRPQTSVQAAKVSPDAGPVAEPAGNKRVEVHVE